MSNSKSSAKRRARRWRGPGNPSCPHALPASYACARRLCCGSPPCRSGSRSPPSSPVSLAEGLPALTSFASRNITHCCLSLHRKPQGTVPTRLWPPLRKVRVTEHPCGSQWPGLFCVSIDPLTLTTTSGQPCTRPGSKSWPCGSTTRNAAAESVCLTASSGCRLFPRQRLLDDTCSWPRLKRPHLRTADWKNITGSPSVGILTLQGRHEAVELPWYLMSMVSPLSAGPGDLPDCRKGWA